MNASFRKIIGIACCALLAACGGSSGSGSRNAASRGAVQRFGSIVVNGVEWKVAGATLRLDDGQSQSLSTEDSIRTFVPQGAVVTVKGDRNGASGTARTIEFKSIVEGPVTNVTATGFSIAGLTIATDASTTFFDASGSPVASLPAGRVEVSGTAESETVLRASMVRAKTGNQPEYEAKGYVVGLSGQGFGVSLVSGGAAYLNVTASSALPAGVANGAIVEVKGTTYDAGTNTLTATVVELEDDLFGDANSEMEVEGVISQLTGSAPNETLVVAGQQVALTASTRFVGAADPANPRADLAAGLKVEVEGQLNASNVLVAEKLQYKDGARLRAVTTVAAGGTSLTALGQDIVAIAGRTRVDGAASLAALPSGQMLEIRGYPMADGTIFAQRVRVDTGGNDRPFLQGVVSNIARPDVTILGITVSLAGAELRSATDAVMTQDQFFAALVDDVTLVKIRWNQGSTSTSDPVDEAEIESEDD